MLLQLQIYIVGGEDPQRALVTDMHVLDLTTNTWSELSPETTADEYGKVPPPRSALVCVAYQDRYMLLFGGGSAAHCHNDFWVFDTLKGAWERPVVNGKAPLARAGCAASLLGNTLYIVGGGNNITGCPDMWTMDMAGLGGAPLQWELAVEFDRHNALATEGASLCSSPAHGALIAFGGYNGTYHNAVSVYKPRKADINSFSTPTPMLRTTSQVESRTPEIMPISPQQGSPTTQSVKADTPNGALTEKQANQLASAAMEEAMAMKEAVNQELSLMRHQLAIAQAAKQAAEKEAQDAQAELAAERDAGVKMKLLNLKLEVEVTNLEGALQGMVELEAEVNPTP